MLDKLCLMVCSNFKPEVAAVLASQEFPEMQVITFPAMCHRPASAWEAMVQAIPEDRASCREIHLLGGGCVDTREDLPKGLEKVHRHQAPFCHSFFAGQELIRGLAKEGAFLMTPGWLAHWRIYLDSWGFSQQTAREFFGESITRLTLIDTGVDPASAAHLRQLAEFVSLPHQIISVGLDFFRLFLARIVGQWRLEREKVAAQAALSSAQQQLAEKAMIVDLMGHMAGVVSEAVVIKNIFNLFNMLCAPALMAYLPWKNGQSGEIQVLPESPENQKAIQSRLLALKQDHAWTESGTGFRLRLKDRESLLGVLEVDGLPFPNNKERYLNLSINIVKVCVLAIKNARIYEELDRALEVRQRAEANLTRQNAVLDGINQILKEALSSETEAHLGRTCLKVLEEVTKSTFGFISEMNPSGTLDAIALSDPGWSACRMAKSDCPVLPKNIEVHGIYGPVITEGRVVIANDPISHPHRIGLPAGHPELTAFLGAPLQCAGKVMGMIGLGNKAGGYDRQDQKAVETLTVAVVEALMRKRAEAEVLRQIDHLRSMAIRLSEVEETERKNLARELHDQVCQNLASLALTLETLKIRVQREPVDQILSRLTEAAHVAEETGGITRNLMEGLRPTVLDHYGLLGGVRWLAGQFKERTGINVEVHGQELEPRLDISVELALFRVAQEALSNVAKHAQASQVALTQEVDQATVRLIIADNGTGLDQNRLAKPEVDRSWGLMNMKERAMAVGGHCRIESQLGQGTWVVVEVPR